MCEAMGLIAKKNGVPITTADARAIEARRVIRRMEFGANGTDDDTAPKTERNLNARAGYFKRQNMVHRKMYYPDPRIASEALDSVLANKPLKPPGKR